MEMKLIGAGFGRTGTMSTYAAMNQLGFPCYHMIEVIQNKANKTHLDFWCKVANAPVGAQHDWQQVFANYSATVDFPAAAVWRELLAAYPAAKVLLTVHPRGAEAWYESVIDTIYFTETKWQFKVLEWTTPFGRKMGEMCHKLIWHGFMRGVMTDRSKAIAFYNQYITDVKAIVPPEQLLVYSVSEGWQPLCAFLGVPEPASEFPNINDRAAIKATISGITRGAYVILGIGGLAAAALVYGIVHALTAS